VDKYYFITVQTYLSVNNMGKELAKYVYEKYDSAVMRAEDMEHVEDDIKRRMWELSTEFPRCRPLVFDSLETKNLYGEIEVQFWAKPQNNYNDNVVFTLRTAWIRKLAIQTRI